MFDFCSIFRKEMNSFLHYQRSIGRTTKSYITIFNRFDQFLIKNKVTEKKISKTLSEQFTLTLDVRRKTLYCYITHFRQFADYLCSLGFSVYKPDLPKLQLEYVPYIFSESEWKSIIEAADNLTIRNCPLYTIQMPILLRILYGCGTRITETLSLKVRDIDFKNGVLSLMHTKNGKQRLVPMDKSLTLLIVQYVKKQELSMDDYLFYMQGSDKRWNTGSVDNCFNRILKEAGIQFFREKKHDRGPCLHCIRHTFVLNSLKKSDKEGRCFYDTVPFLSTYLGHSGIRETDKYLRFCYELYDGAVDKVEAYTEPLFPEVF